jgi:hypothetical protein
MGNTRAHRGIPGGLLRNELGFGADGCQQLAAGVGDGRIFVCTKPQDMRRGIDALALTVARLPGDPVPGAWRRQLAYGAATFGGLFAAG